MRAMTLWRSPTDSLGSMVSADILDDINIDLGEVKRQRLIEAIKVQLMRINT